MDMTNCWSSTGGGKGGAWGDEDCGGDCSNIQERPAVEDGLVDIPQQLLIYNVKMMSGISVLTECGIPSHAKIMQIRRAVEEASGLSQDEHELILLYGARELQNHQTVSEMFGDAHIGNNDTSFVAEIQLVVKKTFATKEAAKQEGGQMLFDTVNAYESPDMRGRTYLLFLIEDLNGRWSYRYCSEDESGYCSEDETGTVFRVYKEIEKDQAATPDGRLNCMQGRARIRRAFLDLQIQCPTRRDERKIKSWQCWTWDLTGWENQRIITPSDFRAM